MIKTRKYKTQPEPQSLGLRKWISEYFLNLSGDFCDAKCSFWINRSVIHLESVCVVDIRIVPRIGCFAGIDFNLKMFMNSQSLINRPRIYNDRRVFHPNINIVTLQIVVQELHNDWNPTHELLDYLKQIKDMIVEPNVTFVPDNVHNRRAAILYHFNREMFPQLIFENQPCLLDEQISQEMKIAGLNDVNEQSRMECQNEVTIKQNDFWNMKAFFSRKKLPSMKSSIDQEQDKKCSMKTIRTICNQIKEISISSSQMINQQ